MVSREPTVEERVAQLESDVAVHRDSIQGMSGVVDRLRLALRALREGLARGRLRADADGPAAALQPPLSAEQRAALDWLVEQRGKAGTR